MTHSIGTYRRTSNWATVALLTVVMIGFGFFAEAHVHQTNATTTASQTTPLNEQVLSDVFSYLF